MINLGIVLLIVGAVVLVAAYALRGRAPAPLHVVGWALVAIGGALIVIALILLAIPADTATPHALHYLTT